MMVLTHSFAIEDMRLLVTNRDDFIDFVTYARNEVYAFTDEFDIT